MNPFSPYEHNIALLNIKLNIFTTSMIYSASNKLIPGDLICSSKKLKATKNYPSHTKVYIAYYAYD